MYSLKTKILAISFILLIGLVTAFVFYSTFTTAEYQRLRLEGIRQAINLEAERANTLIAEIERGALQLAASGLLFQISQSAEIGEIAALEFLRSFPTVIGGGFWFKPYAYNEDRQRMGIHAFFDKAEGQVHLDYIEDDYDYHNMNWYLDIINEISSPYQLVWTEPYIDDTTYSLVTSAGAGIFNSYGDLIGISILDWEISGVINELAAIKPTENSIIVLYDLRHEHIITNTLTGSRAFSLSNLEIIPLDMYRARLPRMIIAASESWKSLYDIDLTLVEIDGLLNMGLNREMNNGWNILVFTPVDEIFIETERRNRRFTLAITLIAAAILAFAYALISKIIYRPIQKLTSSITQISLGNLDIRADADSRDELGLLARAFNKMTSDLEESIGAFTREHAEKERIAAELSIAAEIQASMLPCIFPPFPERSEFEIYATMHPAREVGGDFYDFFFVDKDVLALVVADVSGKGVPAALYMVIAKTLIANNASLNTGSPGCPRKSPKEVFEGVNNMLCENNDTAMFVTAFMAYYHVKDGSFVFVNAGHNPPLVKKDGAYGFLKTKPCSILGWEKNAEYREEEITLGPGDSLYLYTDGVTEAMNAGGEFFSESRLFEVLNRAKDAGPEELLGRVKKEIEKFAGPAEQADDITMLAIQLALL